MHALLKTNNNSVQFDYFSVYFINKIITMFVLNIIIVIFNDCDPIVG